MAKKKQKRQGGVKIPSTIIKIGKILQAISPTLTTKYVRYLFQKPMNHKPRRDELPLLEKAQIDYLAIPEIRKKIAVYHWGDGNKKALVVHGWSSRPTQLYKFIQGLLDKGYMVYSFDGPAHGKSSGNKTMMPEYIKTIEKITEIFGPFEVAIGHSMGGISLLNVQSNHHYFNKIAVIGTPDSIRNIFNNFIKLLELKPIIAEKLIKVFEKITGKKIEEFHGSNLAKNIKKPVLIVHDENDAEVPIEDAENNYNHLQNGKILRTKALGHNRILKDDKVVQSVIDFLMKE